MTFEEAALPLQLVLDGKEDHPRVDLLENRDGKLPRAFEGANRWVPRLGSAAMISLAASFLRHGTTVTRFDVRDLRLNPIGEEDSERISGEIVRAIEEGGTIRAEQLFDDDLRNYLINGFETLIDRRRATVAREGVVFTSNKEKLLQLLRDVWREASGG